MLTTKQTNPAKELVDAYISANMDMLTDLTKDMQQACLDKQYSQLLHELADKLDIQPTDQLTKDDCTRQLAVYQSVIAHANISEKTVPTVLTALVKQAVLRKLANMPYAGRTTQVKHTAASIIAGFNGLTAEDQAAVLAAIQPCKSHKKSNQPTN